MDVRSEFSRGQNTLTVPASLHSKNRQRLCAALKEDKKLAKGSWVLLHGGTQQMRYCSDHEPIFRQESFFHWAWGVEESGFFGAIDVESGKSILFCPKLPQEYAVWMGKIKEKDYFKQRYAVDDVQFVDEIADFLSGQKAAVILTLKGLNTDSGNYSEEATFPGIEKFEVNNSILHPVISECRVIKTPEEIEVIRYSCQVSSEAHKEVMKQIRSGMYEYQLESIFHHHCYYNGGARFLSYTCICASGPNGAILHYGHAGEPNKRQVKDGDMCNFDMGCEYNCYSSDITCAFPVSGKFTEDQKIIYNAVLQGNRAVLNAAKPGVMWTDMHLLAERVILAELKKHGLVKGDVEEMMENRIGTIFCPHGLGHFMGVDTHDCGGYPEGVIRSTLPGLRSLRTARELKENMVITIEPGCYFIEALVEPALKDEKKARFLCPEVIERFKNFGGVRIEDDVVITANGAQLLNDVPRSVEDIEALMASGK